VGAKKQTTFKMDVLDSSYFSNIKMEILRFKGKWYKVVPKPYEPEKQTSEIAWEQIREPLLVKEEIYKLFYEKQRKQAKVLYPSFPKDGE
jgi:hypothetical protein